MSDTTASSKMSNDLKSLLQEADEALSNATGQAGERFDELRERLHAALESSSATFQRLREETVRRAKQADHLVRENPYYAIGIAAGVGALVGILASRSCQQSR